MPIYYVMTDLGCGLMKARDLGQAERKARKEHGDHFEGVREAEPRDIAWVRGMGGYVPSSAEGKSSRRGRKSVIDENRRPTNLGAKRCAAWLTACKKYGWPTSSMSALCDLWWKYHDDNGELIESSAEGKSSSEEENRT